jgi:conjugative relaxase-like TrwC/TraI family protein
VLTLSKLGPGHAQYYEQSVADGREDYYTGKGEEQGSYVGSGSAQLDLAGELVHGDLSKLMRGRHPATERRWHHRQQQAKTKPRELRLKDGTVIRRKASEPVAAYDLTFSAPKSVSVLWALSGEQVATEVKQAHARAAREAFAYMERTACVTRRGRGGKEHARGEGFVGAAYLHRTSRAGDPQLHTHVIVMNATRATSRDKLGRQRTRYSALHATLLYREAQTAGYLYQATLRDELTRTLGVEWTPVVNGMAEIEHVSPELCELFSKRSEEIAQQLARAGHSGAKAANAAAIDTRAAKTYDVDPPRLRERWHDEARTIDAPDLLEALARTSPDDSPDQADQPRSERPIEHTPTELAQELFAPTGLTEQKTTFARRDVLRAVAQDAPRGASIADIERLADQVIDLGSDRITQLTPKDPIPSDAPRRADGAVLTDGRVDRVYSTRELIAAEHSVVASMRDRAHAGVARVSSRDVRTTLDRAYAGLAADQRAMVQQLTTSGAGVEVVVGIGGSGKTTSLAAAHELWQRAGIEVRGTTIADQAARNLHAETGIDSRTIATLKFWVDPPPETGFAPRPDKAFPRGGVLVVDEAGMVPTRDLAFLARGCAEHDTKLVLIGDHRQLPEIDAGGTFRGLVHRFDSGTAIQRLITNRRQDAPWERTALAELRSGDLGKAIAAYAEEGRIHAGARPVELREQLVRDWLAARSTQPEVAMIAYTRADVAILNQLARTQLDQQGVLGRRRHEFAGREYAVGDEVLALRNNRQLGVSNGTRGHITKIGPDHVQLTTTGGDRIRLDRAYLSGGNLTYGYASTGHKSQGRTVHGDAYVLASTHVNREWLYVSMSRAKNASHIYVDVPERDPATKRQLTPLQQQHTAILALHELAHRSDQHTLAIDHTAAAQLTTQDLQALAQRDTLTQRQRDRIEVEKDKRLGALRDRLASNPPRYLLPAIGSIPLDPSKRERWIRDAVRLEQHREGRGLTEPEMTKQRCNEVLGKQRERQQGRGRGR